MPASISRTTPIPWPEGCSWRRRRRFPLEARQRALDHPSDGRIRIGLQAGDPVGYLGVTHLAEHLDHRLAHLRRRVVQCLKQLRHARRTKLEERMPCFELNGGIVLAAVQSKQVDHARDRARITA